MNKVSNVCRTGMLRKRALPQRRSPTKIATNNV